MKPILVFQTDFSYKEGAVCAMYGVVKSVDRELEIIDGTHELPKFDTWSASYRLHQSMAFWPKGTIFVSVVDPGVGTDRRACVAKTSNGYFVVTPDNGSLTHLKHFTGIDEIREIDETTNRLKGKNTEDVGVFHGRDLFSYCAAKLASRQITYEQVGPKYSLNEIVLHQLHKPIFNQGEVKGIIEIDDPHFGNLWTNIPTRDFLDAGFDYGDVVQLTIRHQGEDIFSKFVHFQKSFGYAQKGDVILYNNELMRVGMAVNQGSFSQEYRIRHGPDWHVTISK
ncbi:MAG: SAM-dependent chlorinase/fluorinase [Chloroflexota bacterium]|jgi:S-adenosylmethionine hydrolase|nr:SAM-dependent chlorinase/fluorinase [Chloroflexota bacterium]